MTIRVEFYGIARQRAGREFAEVQAQSLASALEQLAQRFPEFARTCVANGKLANGITANVNGDVFVSNGDCPLNEGDTLLILSADAGG